MPALHNWGPPGVSSTASATWRQQNAQHCSDSEWELINASCIILSVCFFSDLSQDHNCSSKQTNRALQTSREHQHPHFTKGETGTKTWADANQPRTETSGVQFSQGLPLEVINNHGKVLAQRAVSREPGAAVPQSHHISPASHLRAADASTEPPPWVSSPLWKLQNMQC